MRLKACLSKFLLKTCCCGFAVSDGVLGIVVWDCMLALFVFSNSISSFLFLKDLGKSTQSITDFLTALLLMVRSIVGLTSFCTGFPLSRLKCYFAVRVVWVLVLFAVNVTVALLKQIRPETLFFNLGVLGLIDSYFCLVIYSYIFFKDPQNLIEQFEGNHSHTVDFRHFERRINAPLPSIPKVRHENQVF